MDFAYDDTTDELREQLNAFMDEHVYPNEHALRTSRSRAPENPWATPPIMEDLKAEAREPRPVEPLPPATHEHGAGLTNMQYAPLCEIMGRNPFIAPEAFNCSAPDTGNMELLALFGTDEQKRALARAAARGRDPLGVLDDRARRRLLGRDEHRDARSRATATSTSSTAASGGRRARCRRAASC